MFTEFFYNAFLYYRSITVKANSRVLDWHVRLRKLACGHQVQMRSFAIRLDLFFGRFSLQIAASLVEETTS